MRKIAFDFETHPFAPGRQIPPAVCMSFAEFDQTVGRSSVVIAQEGIALLEQWLDAGCCLYGANVAFDVLVSVFNSGQWLNLLGKWVRAYEEGRVFDVLLDQKELDLAAGQFRYERIAQAEGPPRIIHHKYSLDDVARSTHGAEINKGKDDPTHPRLRYAEVDGLPISQYPQPFYDYSLEDSIHTALSAIAQEHRRWNDPRIQVNFPGRDPLADRQHQVMAALPLRSMSDYGLRTDLAAVERLVEDVEALSDEARKDLLAAGLVRREIHADRDGIAARCEEFGVPSARKADLEQSEDPYLQQLPAWRRCSPLVKAVEEAYQRCSVAAPEDFPAANAALLAAKKALDPWEPYLASMAAVGLLRVEYKKNTKAAARRCVAAYQAIGRDAPRTKSFDADKHDDFECIALDVDACEKAEDPILSTYAEYSSLAKTVSTDIPMLRKGALGPIHTRFDTLLETGRTSSSSPNVQNIRRLPGIRECFMPRPGYAFLDADYPMLELHTHAQVCFWQLGFSTLGDALNAGLDPHLKMAETILMTPYDVLKARRAAGDSAVDNARTAGKGVNFGAPGGLGKKTFAHYAWKSYRIKLTEEEAGVLIKQYKDTWKEMPAYFRMIDSLKDARGEYNVVQAWSHRLRAGATYCSACNSLFQGLGSDVAKVALWFVFKACNGLSELGTADPLFGCHPVNFVHDSIMVEVPIDRIHEAGQRLGFLMSEAARLVMPGVYSPFMQNLKDTDVLATFQWSKKAKPKHDELGRLVPWELREACAEALEKGLEKGDAQANPFDYLTSKDWPRDAAREAIRERFGMAA